MFSNLAIVHTDTDNYTLIYQLLSDSTHLASLRWRVGGGSTIIKGFIHVLHVGIRFFIGADAAMAAACCDSRPTSGAPAATATAAAMASLYRYK